MSWVTDLFGSAQSAASTVVDSIADIPSEWTAKVNELKARAQEFMSLFSDLETRAGQAAAAGLSGEYNNLMSRGASIKARVLQVTNAVDGIYNSVSNLFGLSGLGMSGLGNLGVIPLIPIAIIVGAIALMVSWITDAYNLRNKLAAAQAAGANASQITQIASGGSGGILQTLTSGSLVGNAGLFLAIGAGILIAAPLLKRALQNAHR